MRLIRVKFDMDSDEEWAEQGESLSGDSDIEETTHEENDYEMDDWLCSDRTSSM